MTNPAPNSTLLLPDPKHVLECIENWRTIPLKEKTDAEIDDELKLFLSSLGKYLTFEGRLLPWGGPWRIRRLTNLLKNEKECWEPPKNKTNMGRCNAKNAPVLYVSQNITTPLEELSIKPNEQFYLIKYKPIAPLKLFDVIQKLSIPVDRNGNQIFDDNSIISYQIIREFIRCEFLKPVGEGTEYLHRISGSMCRVWFNNDDADGWYYPSVQSPKYFNMAIKPESARKKLRIESIYIAKLVNKKRSHLKKLHDDEKVIIDSAKMVVHSDFKGEIRQEKILWSSSDEVICDIF